MNNTDKKIVLVQCEFVHDKYYEVTIDGKEYTCNCGGVRKNNGFISGEPIYKIEHGNCFHIYWAKKHYKKGVTFLSCGTESPQELLSKIRYI